MLEFFSDFKIEHYLSFGAMIVSIIALLLAFIQSRQAKKALKDATLLSLFSGFDQANGEVMKNPNLLVTVHGLGLDKDDEDLENIAYLAILIDSFQHYWGKEYNYKYKKVLELETNYIHRIVEIEDNYSRWIKLRSINYGDCDKEFVEVMDTLFEEGKMRYKNK